MNYSEDEFLQLSGLQHFLFCRRQWALIHIENAWQDNYFTVKGELMHTRTHNEQLTERRGNIIITRAMRIFSASLGTAGQCDVLEFHSDSTGVKINGWDGKWLPFPVEYKVGKQKADRCDEAQLCAQSMCLEDMLCCHIPEGALFYGETKRRTKVVFDDELKDLVRRSFAEMHELFEKNHTPRVKTTKACKICSLREICLPSLMKGNSVSTYLEESI